MSASPGHLRLATPVVTIVAHILGVVFAVRVRAAVDFAPLSLHYTTSDHLGLGVRVVGRDRKLRCSVRHGGGGRNLRSQPLFPTSQVGLREL